MTNAVGDNIISAPIRQIPLLVKGGSVLVMAPFGMQYVDEIEIDPIEVRIYSGADGSFNLFEDDGVTGDRTANTMINFSWSDSDRKLTVGDRTGAGFTGMLESRKLKVVLVGIGKGAGVDEVEESDADVVVDYNGSEIVVDLSNAAEKNVEAAVM